MIALDISTSPENFSIVDMLLEQQQRTTAVEKFAQLHSRDQLPLHARRYRDLIPLTAPREGEQYAFEVDLDACSGCKSCVSACHNLNGLEDDELWRSVGLLHGGTTQLPIVQHVTTACHHCLEPACLEGCPVNAYEKDPLTGIVRHLDDQCIGCQYCMLKCPYDVPKYSKSKGIVRKCDMCRDRLAVDEAPACVQACPNQAIRIKVVSKQTVVEECEANLFLPGAPEPSYTLPTTTYKTKRSLPRNLLPADYYSARPQHAHLPLVFMLILTQMSVGAFVVEQFLVSWFSWFGSELMTGVRSVHLIAALALGLTGMNASVFHLGRPLYAFRAVIGLRTSWLSREILAFGLFAAMASLFVGVSCLQYVGVEVSRHIQNTLGAAAALTGLAGMFCSVMIYVDTRRPFWNGTFTSVKFFATALVLGLPTALLISLGAAAFANDVTVPRIMSEYGQSLCLWLMGAAAAKLLFESLIFTHLRHTQHTPLKRTALLMTGSELGLTTMKRYFFGIIGGLVLPGVLLAEKSIVPENGYQPLFIGLVVLLMLVALVLGELLERYLFFTAVVAPKMPGSPAS
jgi:formate dehydrogenase iron-sulfur subunit